jgi:hypothetical protein
LKEFSIDERTAAITAVLSFLIYLTLVGETVWEVDYR